MREESTRVWCVAVLGAVATYRRRMRDLAVMMAEDDWAQPSAAAG